MRICYAWLVVLSTLLASSPALRAADFAGGGTGAIPDNNATGITVSFNVSGIAGPVASVRLKMGLTHSYAGDVEAVLKSPSGVSTLLILGRPGAALGQPSPTFGTSADLGGVYEFADDASRDFWAVSIPLSGTTIIPAGKYRTSSLGIPSTRHGGCSTSLAGAFNGLTGAQVNGTWTLTVADRVSSDTGSITSALLSVSAAPDIFANGFETSPRGVCQAPRYDYFGSGRSNYVLVRNTGGGPNGAITWTIKNNEGNTAGVLDSFILGTAAEFFIDLDFDGDSKTDAAVWTPGTGQLQVRRSTRPTQPPISVTFGQSGDDPDHSGDYDGDRMDDFAIYRAGAMSGLPSSTLIRLSGGGTRTLLTGENGAFPSGGIDYTGDGLADMAVQANAGGGAAYFRIFNGVTGALVSTFNLGTPTDLVETGNHTGSAVGDVTVVRGIAGTINWTTRDGQTGVVQPVVPFGTSATDFALVGDYDGDGLDDYAVWRPSVTPGLSSFYVRPSTAPATTVEVPLGANGDYPVGNNRSH